jgi:hypothetical protein
MNDPKIKKQFLREQVMVNSISAAFQHAGVYLNGLIETDPNKKKVRDFLRDRILEFEKHYQNAVIDSQHCSNIEALANIVSLEFKGKAVLRNDRLRIGISQKALNLYLKYLWCLDEILIPPHCPIDRRIIEKLDIQWQQRSQYDWTKLDCIQKYRELISFCKKKAGSVPVAEWELNVWKFI